MDARYGMTLTRREALAAMGALALSLGPRAARAETPARAGRAGIAIQLYTMREPARQDLAGTLQRLRDMGWKYVQWSGMPNLPAQEIRAALDAAGLEAVSAHVGLEGFERDFEGQAAFWNTVGAKDVAVGAMMGDCRDTLDDWLRGVARLDAVGAKLREAGMRLSYHNHHWEFESFPGDPRTKLDIVFEESSPENLFAELDLAWVHVGGADPAAVVRRYRNRCPVVHAKDVNDESGIRFMPLGEGLLDWEAIFQAGDASGIEWYIYEQDSADRDIFECARISLEFLTRHLAA